MRSGHHFRLLTIVVAVAALLTGCSSEPHKTDADLGLNAQQILGRRMFEQHCAECHFAYISRNLRGPSLEALFKKQYMPSGTPANDDRVRDVIVMGHGTMPAFGRVLSDQQVDDLIAYLRTL
ncbi:MAG: c-type cytochrome [Terriglobales bacterium]